MFERQNVIAAVAVGLLFGVSAWLRPDPSPSFHTELGRVAAHERELLNRYAAASADFKAGRINGPAFADIIQRELLEPYADVRRAVEDLKNHSDADEEFLAQLSRFTALRAEGWGLLVEALREQDHDKLRRHDQKMDEAVAIARKLVVAQTTP